MVERYIKRHLAAQVCSANGLRGIFKFSEFWVAPRTVRPFCVMAEWAVIVTIRIYLPWGSVRFSLMDVC